MSGVIVDTSVWIAFFRGTPENRATSDALDYLLSGDEVLVNDIILTELVPFLNLRGESERAASLLLFGRLIWTRTGTTCGSFRRPAFNPESTRWAFQT